MIRTHPWTRAFALASAALMLAVAASPAAAAQSQLNVRSVGEIFVDAQGRASGQNVATSIAEAQGVISGFISLALGAELFESVTIDGFSQAEKIQGVGSSSLVLKGSNAVVSVHDNINTVVKVQTTSATTLHYKLAGDVRAAVQGAHSGIVHLHSASGAYLGSIVAVGSEGAGSLGESFVVTKGEVQARAKAGSQVVFVGKPVYLQADEYQRSVVEAAAEGRLAASYVTEFEGSAIAQSQVDYAGGVLARTGASAGAGVQTEVRSRAEASAMLAYDLAYETLPARNADEVAVYANGQLAARAESAAEVASYAKAGVAAYHAMVHNGRTLVLASTPDFQSAAEHRMTVTANARASTEAQARAENRAQADSRVYGDFEYHQNGKLTGEFLTSIVPDGRSELYSYTSLATRTEVFKSVKVDDGARGEFREVGDHRFQVQGPNADLTLADDLYATLLVQAKARAEVAYELAANVKAQQRNDQVVRLDGPHGYAGAIILVAADAQAQAQSSLRADAEGRVRATLASGASLVFRGASGAEASEDVIADAIARGQIGAQLLAGIQGSAVATASTVYRADVTADIEARARGAIDVDYATATGLAKSFVLDTRGTSLAAKSAADIQVLVNGAAAIPVASAAAALDATAYAKYHATTNLDGSLRILVNTAAQAGASAHVLVQSKVEAAAKAAANADAFGQFKLFYDGTAVGSFVTLKTDQQAGAVSDFTMISTGQAIFSSVAAGASSFVSAGADGASVLQLENRETKMEFSDTTSAFMKIVAKADADVAFRLAADLNAEARAQGVVELVSDTGAHVGSLIITSVEGKAATASYFEANAQGQIRAHLEQGAQVLFRTHAGIEAELSAAQRTMINQAIASGHVAGQVIVQTQASAAAQAHAAAAAAATLEATARIESEAAFDSVAVGAAEAYGQVTSTVTANYYGDVQVLTAATKERVDVTVSSATSVGKTIIVSLDPATVSGMASGNAEILFDGHVASQASSYADILNPNDDNGVAEYFVLAGEAGTQVLVSVPHFSVHTVTLKEREAGTTPLYMVATVVLGLLVVAETALLVRQRRA